MKTEEEIWKDITGLDFIYQASNKVQIKSLKKTWTTSNGALLTKSDTIMKGGYNMCGYKQVCLRKNGKSKTFLIHRLVAIAFIPNPENKPCVNHINGIKTDNRVENLEWCTYSENTIHAHLNGLAKPIKGKDHHFRKNPEKSPFSIKKRSEHSQCKKVINIDTGEVYDTIKDCAEKHGLVYSYFVKKMSGEIFNNTRFKLLQTEIKLP